MHKQETIAHFIDACYLSIKCQMCGEKRQEQDIEVDETDLAERVWQEGWRFQKTAFLDSFSEEPQVLCQHCKDNQR